MSSEAPITTSGDVSGNTRNVSTSLPPANRWRTSATATSVPSTTDTAVDSAATWRLVSSASVSWGKRNGSAQASVKPCHVRLNRPAGSLNENATITAMGMNK